MKNYKKYLIKGLRLTLLCGIGCVSAASMVAYYLYIAMYNISKKMSFKTKLAILVMILSITLVNTKIVEYETKTIENIIEKIEVKTIEVKAEAICEWTSTECKIYNKGIEAGFTPDQAKIAVAISKFETGSFKSSLCVNSNNYGGLYYNGSFMKFETPEAGIDAFINTLKKGYFDKGLVTLEQIQKKYCPEDAKNDPNGLNKNWLSGVTYFYNNL